MVIFIGQNDGMCRALILLALVSVVCGPLGGCGPQAAVAMAALGVLTIPPFGRSPPDMIVSAIRNQDCSIVRVEQGKSYCRVADPPPEPPQLCTRSLATVDCWVNPEALVGPVKPVADGPNALTPAQEAYRTRGWLW